MTIKSAAAPGRTGGQTLVELIVTLGIVGVLSSLALPALDRLVLDSRRTSVVNDLVGALLLARTEAILRRQPVIVCSVRDGNADGHLEDSERRCAGRDWSQGWMVGVWADANGDRMVDSGELTPLREQLGEPGMGITVSAGPFTATPPVRPTGTTVLRPFGQRAGNGTVTICDRRGPAHARGIIIGGNGRTRVASRKADGGALNCP